LFLVVDPSTTTDKEECSYSDGHECENSDCDAGSGTS
jgi:hypothetical protein